MSTKHTPKRPLCSFSRAQYQANKIGNSGLSSCTAERLTLYSYSLWGSLIVLVNRHDEISFRWNSSSSSSGEFVLFGPLWKCPRFSFCEYRNGMLVFRPRKAGTVTSINKCKHSLISPIVLCKLKTHLCTAINENTTFIALFFFRHTRGLHERPSKRRKTSWVVPTVSLCNCEYEYSTGSQCWEIIGMTSHDASCQIF